MGKRKKKMGCLSSLVYIFLLICAMIVVIAVVGGVLSVVAVGFIAVLILWITYSVLKKLYRIVALKFIEMHNSGKLMFIHRFLSVLNIDNWGKKGESEDSNIEHVLEEMEPIIEAPTVIEENEQIESAKETEKVTEEEIIESYKKQYYIVDENRREETATVQCLAPDRDELKEECEPEDALEVENTVDGFENDAKTEIPYKDKFDEEYRKVDTYRDITFY